MAVNCANPRTCRIHGGKKQQKPIARPKPTAHSDEAEAAE